MSVLHSGKGHVTSDVEHAKNNGFKQVVMVQNLNVFSKLFVRYSSGDKRWNEGKKNSNAWMFDCQIKTERR